MWYVGRRPGRREGLAAWPDWVVASPTTEAECPRTPKGRRNRASWEVVLAQNRRILAELK